ncbi:hypothetical protein N4T20_10690 [Flavobacterium sp. TR2]|uniref:hypothetical protein n=1 Tax=Flavobacterium sp. TR2 TaxID=2977321 RepID=UPI0021B0EB60|nr:hypothetical protein [Flavobacterium sp. TR2]UWY30381.1 hypothetical protein N4T20_10690 [Flavobacterium sp. TR2]
MKNISNKKLFSIFVVLLILDIIGLIFQTQKTGAYNLNGSYSEANSVGLIVSVLFGIVISFPLLFAFIAAVIALFMNKVLPYKKRFIRIFLFILVIFYAIFFGSNFVKFYLRKVENYIFKSRSECFRAAFCILNIL